VRSEAAFEELLGKAENLLRLDEDGNPRPQVELARCSNKRKVDYFLLARHLAKIGKLRESDLASDKEIAGFFGFQATEAQRRAFDLKREGKVEAVGRGEYRLVPGRVHDVLKDLGAE